MVAYRRWAVVAGYALVSIAGIGGWIGHNAVEFDNPTVSSVSAYSMLYYRAASVENWATDDDMATIYTNLARRVEERLGMTSRVDRMTRHTHYSGPATLTNAMTATALETFTNHPAQYILTIPIGLGRMYGYSNILPGWLVFEIPWNGLLLVGTAGGLWLASGGAIGCCFGWCCSSSGISRWGRSWPRHPGWIRACGPCWRRSWPRRSTEYRPVGRPPPLAGAEGP